VTSYEEKRNKRASNFEKKGVSESEVKGKEKKVSPKMGRNAWTAMKKSSRMGGKRALILGRKGGNEIFQ